MDDSFWEQKYQAKDTPWNKGEASPGLVHFLARHKDLPRGTVLIPGCGFGHDVRVWSDAGFTATGLDLAPSAAELARNTLAGTSAKMRTGNFLTDVPDEQFDYLFEHTLYCAIEPDQRAAYAEAATLWLKPDGHFLAVHYLIPDTEGPPFGTTRDEVVSRFSPMFALLDEWTPPSYPNRVGLERMFWWRKR